MGYNFQTEILIPLKDRNKGVFKKVQVDVILYSVADPDRFDEDSVPTYLT
jgi:hypothetical protein